MRADGKSINQPQPQHQCQSRRRRRRSPNGRWKVCYVYVIFHIYVYITSIYILLTKCCASARGVPRHVPPSQAPSHAPRAAHNYELIQAPAAPRTLATSCKTTQGQVGNKRKTFIVLCRKLFPYICGWVCGSVSECVCVCAGHCCYCFVSSTAQPKPHPQPHRIA